MMWRLCLAATIWHHRLPAALLDNNIGGIAVNMPKELRRRAARFCPLLAGIASLLALVSSASATTITITTVSDDYVWDINNDGIMDTGGFPNDGFIRVFGQGDSVRGVWEFSLAGIPQTATINSASVTFRLGGTAVNANPMLVYAYAGDGIAVPADGNNISVLAGSFAITGSNIIYSPNLNTAVIQNLVSSGASYLGLVMQRPPENLIFPAPGGDFCSIEASVIAFYQPFCGGFPGSQLTIDYSAAAVPSAVPLPAALPLFAGGLGLVAFLARRRKQKSHAA
jgi:hypothetical protein